MQTLCGLLARPGLLPFPDYEGEVNDDPRFPGHRGASLSPAGLPGPAPLVDALPEGNPIYTVGTDPELRFSSPSGGACGEKIPGSVGSVGSVGPCGGGGAGLAAFHAPHIQRGETMTMHGYEVDGTVYRVALGKLPNGLMLVALPDWMWCVEWSPGAPPPAAEWLGEHGLPVGDCRNVAAILVKLWPEVRA